MIGKRRRIRPIGIALILVAGGIAAFVLWPRPALVPYTSPPLDSKGTRIRLLIPRGWQPSIEGDPYFSGRIEYTFEPPRPAGSLWSRIAGVFSAREDSACLAVKWIPQCPEMPLACPEHREGHHGVEHIFHSVVVHDWEWWT